MRTPRVSILVILVVLILIITTSGQGLPLRSQSPSIVDINGKKLTSLFEGISPITRVPPVTQTRRACPSDVCGQAASSTSTDVVALQAMCEECPYCNEVARPFDCYEPPCWAKICSYVPGCNCSCKEGYCSQGGCEKDKNCGYCW